MKTNIFSHIGDLVQFSPLFHQMMPDEKLEAVIADIEKEQEESKNTNGQEGSSSTPMEI